MSNVRWVALLVILLPIGSLGAVYWIAPRVYEEDLATRFSHREAEWTGSTTCQSCHPDQYASWHRTFHRTMTQEASPQTVRGAFDGQKVTYWGVTARPYREGERFFIDYLDKSGRVFNTLEILRTVGSRRYQQYLARSMGANEQGENYYRIPLLWHIGDERWIHLNGAFLGHDDEPYDKHVAIWNQNCVFCHNTGPVPGSLNYDEMIARGARGEPVNPLFDQRFESSVAELGIACESCHAPSGEHAARNRNPLRRYLLHLRGADDPTIVNPAKLDQERSVEVCGQCHGQRLPNPPDSVRNWMIEGPPYRAGEVLTAGVKPVTIATGGPPHDPTLFSLRFWQDGTPRLTAYEYQGVVMSPCYLEGELTCNSCHSMHGGDIRGQIEPAMRTNEACASCHQDLVDDVQAHSFHEPASSGSLCYDCHMPKMVYGVLEIHRSHHIENPDPAADAENARPNACTTCHVDQTATWAAEKAREWWGGRDRVTAESGTSTVLDVEVTEQVERYRKPLLRGDGAPLGTNALTASLLAGDPVQRAVAARLAGRRDTPLSAEQRAFLWPLLIQGLQDPYPTIRYFSSLSLEALQEEMTVPGLSAALGRFDYIAPGAQRAVVVEEILGSWESYPKDHLPPPPPGTLLDADYRLLTAEIKPLLELQANKLIHIGE